jgi:uncharacterized membrane protein YjjB (DUF3815 family)
VDGADVGVVSFLLCVSFELDALALTVEWSSWAICYVCGGRGEGRYLNEMAGFGVSAASATACVGMKRGSCDCGDR